MANGDENNGNGVRKIKDYIVLTSVIAIASLLNYFGVRADLEKMSKKLDEKVDKDAYARDKETYREDKGFFIRELDKKVDKEVFYMYKAKGNNINIGD